MLDDHRAATRQHERHGGRDVEEVKLVAAGAAHVDGRAGQAGGVDLRVHGAGQQRAGESDDFGGGLALGAQGAQEGGLGGVGNGGICQGSDGGLDLRRREFGCVDERWKNAHRAEESPQITQIYAD